MPLNNPWWLGLLVLIPAAYLVRHLILPAQRLPANLQAGSRGPLSWRSALRRLPEVWRILALTLVVIGLAGPIKTDPGAEEHRQGLKLAVVIDRSGSMGLEIPGPGGGWVQRFEAVKTLTGEFLSNRPDDQVTLISFAHYPETHTPLTLNKDIVKDLLAKLRLAANQDEDGTAIGDALALATARLAQSRKGAGSTGAEAIILLTDGQNNRGEVNPLEGALQAKAQHLRIYAIGLGGQGTMVQRSPFGDVQRLPVGSDLDEPTLNEIAHQTGGEFFRLDRIEDLKAVYETIGKLEKQRLDGAAPTERHSDFELWFLLALACVGLEALSQVLLLRRLP